MDETRKLTLKKPVRFGEDTISVLEFREPEGADWRGLVMRTDGVIDMDTMMTLASRLSGQPPSVIDRLKGRDFSDTLAIVGGFIGGGQGTGK